MWSHWHAWVVAASPRTAAETGVQPSWIIAAFCRHFSSEGLRALHWDGSYNHSCICTPSTVAPPPHHPPNMRNVFKNSIADEWSCLGSEREEISQVSAERVMTSRQQRFIMSEWRWNLSYAEKGCKIYHLGFFYLIKSAAQRFFSRTTKKQRTQIALNCQQMADIVVQFHSFMWLNLLSRSLWSRFPRAHAQTRDLSLCCSSPGKTEKVWAGKNAHLHKFHSSELGQPDSQDNEFPSKRFFKMPLATKQRGNNKMSCKFD